MGKQEKPNNAFTTHPQRILLVWRLFFIAATMLGGISAFYMLSTKTGGISSVDRLILAGISLAALFFLFLFLLPWSLPNKYTDITKFLAHTLKEPKYWCSTLILAGIILIGGTYLITQTPTVQEPFSKGILLHLQPIFSWLSALGLLTLIALPTARYGSSIWHNLPKEKLFYFTLLYIILVFAGWGLISGSYIKAESRFTGWNSLGVPILETQILTAWLAIVLILLITAYYHKEHTHNRFANSWNIKIDVFVFLLLWLFSAFLWIKTPVQPNWFLSKPRSPNHEFYPNSDALSYDITAQNALVGEGYIFLNTPFIRRPMHAFYLTGLHTIAGQDYLDVANLQALILAIFPGLIYIITKLIHNRISGILAGILIMLREANAIALSGSITTANAKLLMVDLPAAVVVAAFTILVIAWLQKPGQKRLFPLLAGGLLGIGILIRAEISVLLFGVLIFAAIIPHIRQHFRQWFYGFLLLIFGSMLVVSPWIYRNWSKTGLLFLDSPIHRADLIAQRFLNTTDLNALLTPTLPVQSTVSTPISGTQEPPVIKETSPATPAPENTANVKNAPSQSDILFLIIAQSAKIISEHPKQVSLSITSHFLNSQMQMLLIPPTLFRGFTSVVELAGHRSFSRFYSACCAGNTYIKQLPYWWKWDGHFQVHQIILLVFNSLILSFGILAAWRKKQLTGLIPLAFAFIYTAFNALLRNSGGRYILPVDWASVVYYSIGVTHLTENAISCYIKGTSHTENHSGSSSATKQYTADKSKQLGFGLGLTVLFLIIGLAVPLTEKNIPVKYPDEKKQQMLNTFMQSDILPEKQRSELKKFANGSGTLLVGRALYPRYFGANKGEPSTNNPFGPKQFSRLVFHLAGPKTTPVILPIEKAPKYIPNSSDVLVFGCKNGAPLAVVVFSPQTEVKAIIYQEPLPAEINCPLPSPEPENP